MPPFTNNQWREALGQPDLTDEEIEEFRRDLQAFLRAFLDDYFREECEHDNQPP